jgi:hypothetical protein
MMSSLHMYRFNCNLQALDTAGAARGSLLFPTLPLIASLWIPRSQAVVGQLHPVIAGPGQFVEAVRQCATRVPIVALPANIPRCARKLFAYGEVLGSTWRGEGMFVGLVSRCNKTKRHLCTPSRPNSNNIGT